jgi:hypothetical protein
MLSPFQPMRFSGTKGPGVPRGPSRGQPYITINDYPTPVQNCEASDLDMPEAVLYGWLGEKTRELQSPLG